MTFLLKIVTVFFTKKARFDYKNNYGYNKLANFRLDSINKINLTILVVILYISLELGLRKI